MKEAWTLETILAVNLKFPTFTFNKPKGWSISALNTEANSAAFIMRRDGDHLNFAICQEGSQKFYSYSRGITKNLQNFKNFQSPLEVKNDTSFTTLCKRLENENELPQNCQNLITTLCKHLEKENELSQNCQNLTCKILSGQL